MHSNYQYTKKYLQKIFVAILLLVVAILGLSTLFGNNVAVGTFYANSDTFVDYSPIQLEIPNKHFDDISGSYPMTANGWSDQSSPFAGDGNNGVVDLTPNSFDQNRKTYNLLSIDDDGNISELQNGKYIDTPFYSTANENTKTALMVNTEGAQKVTGQVSSTMSLSANRYYMISVWVKTSNFAEGTGASIALNGLKHELAFTGINTTTSHQPDTQANNFNWKRYSFFIKTGFETHNVTLSLSVGYTAQTQDTNNQIPYYPANGYAFFDNIVAEQLSPILYNRIKPTDAAQYGKDYTDNMGVVMIPSSQSQFVYEPYDTRVLKVNDTSTQTVDEVSAAVDIDIANWSGNRTNVITMDVDNFVPNQNIKTNPMSPTGSGNVTLMTTYRNGGAFVSDSLSLTSIGSALSPSQPLQTDGSILIKRQQYYRFSVWLKTIDVSEGIGAYVRFIGENTQYNSDPEQSFKLNVLDKNLTSDDNTDNYGWVEKSYYIKGSSIKDNNIQVVIGLGHRDEGLAKGNAFFANPSMTVITAKEFEDNSQNGTVIEFDSTVDTGIANGNFALAGNFLDYKYPLPAASWNIDTANSGNTNGWSGVPVNMSGVSHGIIPTDNAHFEQHKLNGSYPSNLVNPIKQAQSHTIPNLMMLHSSNPTAFGMVSQTISVPSGTPKAITVTMLANTTGYGANIILKDDSSKNILATIEGIKDTKGELLTYTFYLEADTANPLDSLTIEIWLGMGDRVNNLSKLSSGYILVSNVSFVDFTKALPSNQSEFSFADKFEEYKSFLARDYNNMNYAMYSSVTDSIFAFDRYQDSKLKTPYNWSIASSGGNAAVNNQNTTIGIYNGTQITTDGQSNGFAPYNFKHDSDEPFGVYMSLNSPTAATLSNNKTYSVEANSYYKLTTRLNANLTGLDKENTDSDNDLYEVATESVGLGIVLNGTNFKFEDIRDTRKSYYAGQENYEWQKGGYKDFTFYVATSGSADPLSLSYTLGDPQNRHKWAIGQVYISGTSIEKISKTTFDKETQGIVTDKDSSDYDPLENRLVADFGIQNTNSGDSSNNNNTQLNAILIPSILFSVALILAVIGIILRKISQKTTVISKPTTVISSNKPSYDRSNAVLNSMDVATNNEPSHDYFDEDFVEIQTVPSVKDSITIDTIHSQFDEDMQDQLLEQNQDDQIAVITSIDQPIAKKYKTKFTTQKTINKTKTSSYVDEFDD